MSRRSQANECLLGREGAIKAGPAKLDELVSPGPRPIAKLDELVRGAITSESEMSLKFPTDELDKLGRARLWVESAPPPKLLLQSSTSKSSSLSSRANC